MIHKGLCCAARFLPVAAGALAVPVPFFTSYQVSRLVGSTTELKCYEKRRIERVYKTGFTIDSA
jgi:hypothetical protein